MSVAVGGLEARLLEAIERGDFVVPPYPAAALRLRSLLENDRYGLSQVAEAVSADAAIAAALLRIANSAAYRSDGPPVTTLLRAVNRIGARAVSSLALAAGLGATACAPGPLADVKYRAWRRSITCALAAQRFSAARGVDPEVAFLAGLLHGFGRSVALVCIEKVLAAAPEVHSVPEWLDLVERHRAKLAERVARLWELPAPILAAMSDDAGSSAASSLVGIADAVAAALDRGTTTEDLASELGLDEKQAAQLGIFARHLPGALEVFTHAPVETGRRSLRAPSAVLKPSSLLPGELRSLTLPVTDLRKAQPEPFEGVGIALQGLVVTSGRPVHESTVVRLRIEGGEGKLEAWFNVLSCTPEGQRFRLELQLFAASNELRDRLAALWRTAPPLAAPPPQVSSRAPQAPSRAPQVPPRAPQVPSRAPQAPSRAPPLPSRAPRVISRAPALPSRTPKTSR